MNERVLTDIAGVGCAIDKGVWRGLMRLIELVGILLFDDTLKLSFNRFMIFAIAT